MSNDGLGENQNLSIVQKDEKLEAGLESSSTSYVFPFHFMARFAHLNDNFIICCS